MNSTLDDNRLFTIANGERFYLGDQFNIIIESENLEFASPATISRIGLIYVNMEETAERIESFQEILIDQVN